MSKINNITAHRVAQSAMLDDIKDQNTLEESIYTELQIAEKRGEILAKHQHEGGSDERVRTGKPVNTRTAEDV